MIGSDVEKESTLPVLEEVTYEPFLEELGGMVRSIAAEHVQFAHRGLAVEQVLAAELAHCRHRQGDDDDAEGNNLDEGQTITVFLCCVHRETPVTFERRRSSELLG